MTDSYFDKLDQRIREGLDAPNYGGYPIPGITRADVEKACETGFNLGARVCCPKCSRNFELQWPPQVTLKLVSLRCICGAETSLET